MLIKHASRMMVIISASYNDTIVTIAQFK